MKRTRHDVAILGSGIAGSMLAAVLARQGLRVLLTDPHTHPRFAIGESTIPYSSALARIIATRYKVPEIEHLGSFRDARARISGNCGMKQNFGFVFHREGDRQRPEETNQFVIPSLLHTETHLFRQDVDAYMFNVALKYGAEARTGTEIVDMDIEGGSGVLLYAEDGAEFAAECLIDAGGFHSPLSDRLHLREEPTRARHHSRSLFTHMLGVTPYDHTPAGSKHGQPSRWHAGTLHHVFDGGWLWVIPFNNHRPSPSPLCSVGLTLDPRKHPDTGLTPQQEFSDFLERFPDIACQFRAARPVRPWTATRRNQYSSLQVVGDRFCVTSHAAGFVDALYSHGIANSLEVVNSLAWRLIAAARDGDWSMERFHYIEELRQGLFDFHDDLVFAAFVAFRHYDLWNAVFRTWAMGVIFGALMLEDAYFAFARHGAEQVIRDLEQARYPGSPFPVSDGYNALGPLARRLCQDVEDGSLAPAAAGNRLFAAIQQADFLPPSFGLDDPDRRFIDIGPLRMAQAARWARTAAPREVGTLISGAARGLLGEHVRQWPGRRWPRA